MKRTTVMTVVVAALVGWFANDALSEDPEMPSEAEMRAEMMRLGTPGAAHEVLQNFVGDFDAKTTMYMAGGESEGVATSTQKSMCDGRFISIDYAGDFGGTPFNGIGMMGYDNFKQKYWTTWTDSFSTNIVYAEGTCSDDHKVITLNYTMPTKWGDMKSRMVYTIKSADQFELESFTQMEGMDAAHKDIHITFTKKRAATAEK